MDYNFFLFSKIYDLHFNSELEYDLLFDKLLFLYEEWKKFDSDFGRIYNTYESMEEFLKG